MAVQPQTHKRDSAEDARAGRCVRAQAFVREVNEQIHQLGPRGGRRAVADLCRVICECTNADCLTSLQIPAQAYAQVRRFPTRFILAPEHVVDAFQRVVEEAADYVVVETTGPAAATAVRLDPQRGGTGQ